MSTDYIKGEAVKKIVIFGLVAAVIGLTAGCSVNDADVVNRNISTDADNFKIPRRITFINGITDNYLLTIEGYCSIDSGNPAQLTVTCAVAGGYNRSYLGRSDNVTWIAEQLEPAKVSANFYKVTFKPSVIIPNPELR
jgi:hypothetical protein